MNNDNTNDNKKKKKNNNGQTIMMMIIMTLVSLMIVTFIMNKINDVSNQEISYDQFMDMLSKGEVA